MRLYHFQNINENAVLTKTYNVQSNSFHHNNTKKNIYSSLATLLHTDFFLPFGETQRISCSPIVFTTVFYALLQHTFSCLQTLEESIL